MIDSVLKGTGNSRFLKSAVPAGTSWADALAMLQAGTFPIDFNGINTEGFQQVGTPLNKANLLKDATAAQIGLPPSTTPDGMFQALGNTGELHVWRKTVTTAQEIPAGYTLGASAAKTLAKSSENSGNSYATFYISSSISVDDAGNVTMNSPATVDIWQGIDGYDSDERAIFGKFIKFHSVSSSNAGITSDLETGIYFIPNSAEFTRYRDGKRSGYTNISACQKVISYPLTPAGTTTTYPVSTNPNAYQEGDDAKAAGYVLGDVVTGKFSLGAMYASNGHIIKYADSVTVSDDGTVALSNESTFTVGSDGYTQSQIQAACAGKFIQYYRTSSGSTYPPDSIYPFNSTPSAIVFVPSDVSIVTKVYDDYDCYAIDRYQPVTGYPAIPAGTTIEYLGKLGDKVRVQVLSYVGTGTYGSSNPNSLTFDFVPKVILFMYRFSNSFDPNSAMYARFVSVAALKATYKKVWFAQINSNGNAGYMKISEDRKTVSWYNTYGAFYQNNESGTTYVFLAIG